MYASSGTEQTRHRRVPGCFVEGHLAAERDEVQSALELIESVRSGVTK